MSEKYHLKILYDITKNDTHVMFSQTGQNLPENIIYLIDKELTTDITIENMQIDYFFIVNRELPHIITFKNCIIKSLTTTLAVRYENCEFIL